MPPVADLAATAMPHQSVTAPVHANGWRPIRVEPGDTLWQLAVDHRTTVAALRARNGLGQGSMLYAGQRLLVPSATPKTTHSATRTVRTYTVRRGDTMEAIARRYGQTLAQLLRANPGVSPHAIRPGQRIILNGRASATPRKAARPAAPPRKHTVKAGETLTSIAAAYGTTLDRLERANPKIRANVLLVGQQVALPGVPKATPRRATAANTFAGYTYPPATVRAAEANRARLARRHVPTRTQSAALIRKIASRHGVDPKLALAVAYNESGWNQRMVSVGNAIGTMQVIPLSGEWASQLAGRRLDLLDAEDNITAGVVILRALQAAASSREEAVAAYYQGLKSVRANGMYDDTKGYVRTVLALYKRM